MKVVIEKIKEGEFLPRPLDKSGAVPSNAPADGLLIGREGHPPVYVRLSDLERAIVRDSFPVVTDPWREDAEEADTAEVPAE